MPRTPLENELERQISFSKEKEFQAFVAELMLLVHSADGFTNLRDTKDEGCDGFLEKERAVLACWGPGKIMDSKLQKAFEKKVKGDFDSYQKNWESRYPKWKVVINHHATPAQRKYVEDLKPGSPIIGLENLISMIMNDLCSTKRRKICKRLLIPEEMVSKDILVEFLEDILGASDSTSMIKYPKALNTPEKIELNFSPHEADAAQNEFDYLQEKFFSIISDSLREMEPSEIKRVKNRIVSGLS